MDSFRMLTEAQRRIKDSDNKVISLAVSGLPELTLGTILEINQQSGYVEFKTKTKGNHLLIAINSVNAVNLLEWRPDEA